MTILPKKKHQEARKNEQEHDIDNRNRHRNRSRDSRTGRTQEDPSSVDTTSSNTSLSKDLESQESTGLPHKRSRHTRQQSSFYSSSSSTNPLISKRNCKTRDGSESANCSGGGEDTNEDGYNSSDEHGPRENKKDTLPDENILERENRFEHELREKKGFIIKQMATDGACMFRAVADQVYGDQEMHGVVRRHCMDYMVKNRDFFSPYITEDFTSYIRRKRNEHSHGNHTEMQALSEMYNRPIEVYQYSYEPINTFHSRSHNSDDTPPIRLSYHGNVHYNSITDPYNPTVGVGLGLAGYKPGNEDDRLLKTVSNESEALLLEQAMLEDKIKATDWEATDEHLAEIAARESYIQWLKDRQSHPNTTSEASSSKSTSTKSWQSPPRDGTHHNSPPHELQTLRRSPPKDVRRSPLHQSESDRHSLNDNNNCKSPRQPSASSERLQTPPPPVPLQASTVDWSYALNFDSEWGTDPVLAAVLAQSQEEYFQSLAKNNKSSDTSGGSCSKF